MKAPSAEAVKAAVAKTPLKKARNTKERAVNYIKNVTKRAKKLKEINPHMDVKEIEQEMH